MNTVIDRADATLTAIGRALGEPAWATLEDPLADPPPTANRSKNGFERSIATPSWPTAPQSSRTAALPKWKGGSGGTLM